MIVVSDVALVPVAVIGVGSSLKVQGLNNNKQQQQQHARTVRLIPLL